MALLAECTAALLSFREPSFSNISVILQPQHRNEIKVIVLSLCIRQNEWEWMSMLLICTQEHKWKSKTIRQITSPCWREWSNDCVSRWLVFVSYLFIRFSIFRRTPTSLIIHLSVAVIVVVFFRCYCSSPVVVVIVATVVVVVVVDVCWNLQFAWTNDKCLAAKHHQILFDDQTC